MTHPPHDGTTPPRPAPATLSHAEAASTATAAGVSEREEEQRRKAKENLDVGATATVFGSTVLLGGLFLPKEAKQLPGNAARLTVSLLLSFATFLTGKALVLLSLTMMGRQVLVSDGHRVAAKCLVAVCAVLSVLTLLSLLALLPGGGVYLYIGLAVVTAVTLSAAGAHWWLLRRMNGGGGGEAAAAVYYDEENEGKEEMDAAYKTTCSITNSAFGGLVGVLFSASSKISGAAAADSVQSAAHVAIFFTFTTAILGVFVMTVSKVVTNNQRRRRRRCSRRRLLAIATAMRLANALLLCSLACAAFSAAFVVLRYLVFAAFAPLVLAAALCFLLRHCVVVVVVRHDDRDGEEARVKAMEDIASKVTAATLGGIMSILGGALGEKDDRDKWGSTSTGVVMVVLTSAFVSGFGFMVLAAAPGSATAILAPVARVLVWSTVALFTATAVAVYGAEMSGLDNPK
ncbi:hypothetical protein BDA96_10G230700 [Sorghum bicolor]|nr:uncharacterized protein LOC8079314 isoform X2 [Sorghum bicolor]KAG0514871.1 hypothetical protein BDA96_10G230700 [Sorghum bicolor]KXG20243.1 hypothetical protein SORBI_3010G175200 [Sorghum bicolor]OQU76620.1 hypothetical protein SORBI_3010G175200 [Sorghum bicolor]OQU76621.1 hypothetical protein SORBI_3010G175200 [Sorghum bicolor]|eukprot:XP_021304697.1 uncharacterized protein LOC8079314 isoform X2 [Sorghum bicolor]